MFTGIIEAKAKILEITDSTISVEKPGDFDDLKIGSSVCVSGCCLSVIEMNDDFLKFDVMNETWDKTNLRSLSEGDSVNLERALSANGRFEGHIVQGHVDCTGIIKNEGEVLTLEIPNELQSLIVQKGSIAIDGVSLTVSDISDSTFSVALIPHTLEQTTLGNLKVGDTVNLEADILGKYMISRN
jgi:riboflavin synthase